MLPYRGCQHPCDTDDQKDEGFQEASSLLPLFVDWLQKVPREQVCIVEDVVTGNLPSL